jgi:transposase-like protein
MPKRYGKEFRRAICDRLVAGERVSRISSKSGVSPTTLRLCATRSGGLSGLYRPSRLFTPIDPSRGPSPVGKRVSSPSSSFDC